MWSSSVIMLSKLMERWMVPSIRNSQNAKLYKPSFLYARVINVYDGDTITIARRVFIGFFSTKVVLFKVRLEGIDCPEIRGSLENEKHIALIAKQFLSSMILNKKVKLDISGYDKYGRILAKVFFKNQNISELFLSLGLAIEYDGKTKKQVNWLELVKEKSPNLLIKAIE